MSRKSRVFFTPSLIHYCFLRSRRGSSASARRSRSASWRDPSWSRRPRFRSRRDRSGSRRDRSGSKMDLSGSLRGRSESIKRGSVSRRDRLGSRRGRSESRVKKTGRSLRKVKILNYHSLFFNNQFWLKKANQFFEHLFKAFLMVICLNVSYLKTFEFTLFKYLLYLRRSEKHEKGEEVSDCGSAKVGLFICLFNLKGLGGRYTYYKRPGDISHIKMVNPNL